MHRIFYIDILNIFACISVIALHCNGYTHTYAHDNAWHQALVFETIFYQAVPIFFMLSGATLFNFKSRYSVKKFYKKRFSKTLIPYLFFATLFLLLRIFQRKLHTDIQAINVHDIIASLLTGQIPFANFWFFIPLFVLYLFIPYLEKIVNHSTSKELVSLIILTFTFQAIVPILNHYGNYDITQSSSLYGFSLYAILGYTLNKFDFEKNTRFIIILGILTLALWVARYVGLSSLTERSPLWFNYFGLFAVIPATTLFLIAKRLNNRLNNHPSLTNKIKQLSSLSFGIYLIHGVFLYLLPFNHSSFSYRVLSIPLTYASCGIIVFAIKKIPLIKQLVP